MKRITLLAAIATCLMALMQVYYLFLNVSSGYVVFEQFIINLIYGLGYGMLCTFFYLLYKKQK